MNIPQPLPNETAIEYCRRVLVGWSQDDNPEDKWCGFVPPDGRGGAEHQSLVVDYSLEHRAKDCMDTVAHVFKAYRERQEKRAARCDYCELCDVCHGALPVTRDAYQEMPTMCRCPQAETTPLPWYDKNLGELAFLRTTADLERRTEPLHAGPRDARLLSPASCDRNVMVWPLAADDIARRYGEKFPRQTHDRFDANGNSRCVQCGQLSSTQTCGSCFSKDAFGQIEAAAREAIGHQMLPAHMAGEHSNTVAAEAQARLRNDVGPSMPVAKEPDSVGAEMDVSAKLIDYYNAVYIQRYHDELRKTIGSLFTTCDVCQDAWTLREPCPGCGASNVPKPEDTCIDCKSPVGRAALVDTHIDGVALCCYCADRRTKQRFHGAESGSGIKHQNLELEGDPGPWSDWSTPGWEGES